LYQKFGIDLKNLLNHLFLKNPMSLKCLKWMIGHCCLLYHLYLRNQNYLRNHLNLRYRLYLRNWLNQKYQLNQKNPRYLR
jgi:hypothetical protein